ncbi:S49 family peptidase [Micavibrio aeruginosavorus]|uniref:S49 family peptidase n=1 Tax=Micavibrio aeruginosavorus TaxID=349221 RepID=UPI0005A24EAB|nr:S49 family peptidase [Micavibrio aeruginosavorus]
MRIWNRIAGEPWAITETALHTILEIAARENESPQAVAAKLGRNLQNTYSVTEREGVAIIPVAGPLFRYANLFTMISGASSYELIARDFTAALENPNIKGIILDIDSPGGEVNGVSELSNMVYAARGKKPVVAYASGDAASGAYWIASAADEIVVSETSAMGSIGVVGMYQGKSGKSAETVEIVSSQSPHKRLDPTSDDGRSRIQARIDSMADVFIGTIARNRDVSVEDVQNHYGGGDVMIGAKAVNAGMADRVGSLEGLIAELSSPTSPRTEGFFNAQNQPPSTQEKKPMDIETLKKDHPDLVAQLTREGASAEKTRLGAILGSEEAKGREKLAKEMALNTDINAIEACQLMACAPVEEPKATTSFEKVMSTVTNPAITPASDDADNDIDAVASRIAAAI